jgi:calcium-dependent protein kinase
LFKCDIWSIGVILFLLFCGQLPYNGSNINKLVKDIIRGKLKCKSDHKVPEIASFIDLVKNLLANKATDRFDATTALNHRFFKKPLTRAIVLTNEVLN